jgi:hypothetical protein
MFLSAAIIDGAEEFDAVDLVGEGGGIRDIGCAGEKTASDCDFVVGLLGTNFVDRIFKCACSKLRGFVGEGLSCTERTDAA